MQYLETLTWKCCNMVKHYLPIRRIKKMKITKKMDSSPFGCLYCLHLSRSGHDDPKIITSVPVPWKEPRLTVSYVPGKVTLLLGLQIMHRVTLWVLPPLNSHPLKTPSFQGIERLGLRKWGEGRNKIPFPRFSAGLIWCYSLADSDSCAAQGDADSFSN